VTFWFFQATICHYFLMVFFLRKLIEGEAATGSGNPFALLISSLRSE
jgi:hypothetical protein